MKDRLEVIISSDSFIMTCGRDRAVEEVQLDGVDFGEVLRSFREKHKISGRTVNIFLAEELVYMTSIDLPAKTANIGEAISFQLGILAPFPEEDYLYSYSTIRNGDTYKVTVSSAKSVQIIAILENLIQAGFIVAGIYPEIQRYVTGKWRKIRWAFVMPGKRTKIYVFADGHYVDRFISNSEDLTFDELMEICDTENIFHLSPPVGSNFKSVQMLLAAPPMLKEHNLLPASYRRRDYLKIAVIALVVMNLFGLVAVGNLMFSTLTKKIEKIDSEISRLQPVVREVKKSKGKIRAAEEFIELVSNMKGNPDLFSFVETLTMELPEGSYLNQLRFDASKGTVSINGFTDNVGILTEKLQAVGESRLQSTSRRKNMTYFQMEISLQ